MHTWSLLHEHRGLYQTTEQKHQNLQHKRTAAFFSSTSSCSGGLHGWGGHRRRASLTSSQHSCSKANAGSRLNLQWVLAIAQNIDRAWLSHPAPHTCSWGAFLLGFWSIICLLLLLLTRDEAKDKKSWGFQCSPHLHLSPGKTFQDAVCLLKPWLRQAGESRQMGHLMVTLSSYLISVAQEGILCLQFTAKATHHKCPQNPPRGGGWGTLGANQQALAQDVVHQVLSLYFREVSGRRFRSKTLAQNSCRVFVSNNISNLHCHSHNERNIAISHQQ